LFVARLVAGRAPKIKVRQEAALADDEAEIVRLLEALNGADPAEISGRSVDIDAAIWVSRVLRWGADMGLSPYVSTLILSETLNEIRAASSSGSNARGRKRRRVRMVSARRETSPSLAQSAEARRRCWS
jgi:hypothetical protein